MNEQLKEYLRLGWRLFPVKHRAKAPLTAHGWKDASNSEVAIEEWSERFGACNWAVATGPSNLVVVDGDVAKGGTREAVEAVTGPLPPTVEAKSGGGGFHLIYKLPDSGMGTNIRVKSRLGFVHGVDILAATGYIIVAPSVHPSGSSYSWVRPPGEFDIAPAPSGLLTALTLDTGPVKKLREVFGKPAEELYLTAGAGRWGYFQRFAGLLRATGWSSASIEGALLSFYENQCEEDPDLPGKIRNIANWTASLPAENSKQIRTQPAPKARKFRVRGADGKEMVVHHARLQSILDAGGVLLSEEENNQNVR